MSAESGPASFLKSERTATEARDSQAELEQMVRRYGCTGFLVEHDWQARTARVRFTLPLSAGQAEPVRVEIIVDPRRVLPRLTRNKSLEQAERVAWRHVILWADAALSLVAAGLQTVEEAFLAHAVIRTRDGREARMIDYLGALSGGTNVFPALSSGNP